MFAMTNATTILSELPPPIQAVSKEPRFSVRPLTIGHVSIGFPVVQAALSGYSDGPMRIIARQMGASYTLAEVMVDRFVRDLKQRHRTRRHLMVTDEEHPVGGQLMGSSPEDFPPAAQRLVEAGFDVIDINFGCPVKSTAGNCRGGFLLSQPDVALEIVRRTRDAVPSNVPVTLKMRRGLDDSAESGDRFYRILDGAFAYGVAAITVHGRTVDQKYIGPSNWDFLYEVKRHAGDKIILGSGDLFTPEACLQMLTTTGVDGVSVARGAIGNPWIFSQVRELVEGRSPVLPNRAEQRRVMELHYSLAVESSDVARAVTAMRMFGVKFARWHPQFEQVRNDFAAMRTEADLRAVLERWY